MGDARSHSIGSCRIPLNTTFLHFVLLTEVLRVPGAPCEAPRFLSSSPLGLGPRGLLLTAIGGAVAELLVPSWLSSARGDHLSFRGRFVPSHPLAFALP